MTPVVLFVVFLSMAAVPPAATQDKLEDASEVIAKVNQDTTTRLEHGDIRISWQRNADPCTAAGCKWPKYKGYVHVPVRISSSYTRQQRSTIINALLFFHQNTCIRFFWRRRQHHYLYFYSGSGCWSYLGRQRQRQAVSLKANGCLYADIIQHEVLHALGFHHEQVRSDRDDFVKILYENIEPGRERNFQKVQTNNLNTPYDYDSVMHYGRYAFSANGQPTIVAKGDPNRDVGAAQVMSANDIARVNRLYQC